MILPILISVALAPGSYRFCACAVVTAEMAATASAVRATHRVMRASIVSSLCRFIFAECRRPAEDWQGQAYSARRNGIVACRQLCDDCAMNWNLMAWN